MKAHHFQRYHSKETIPTANTLLLLSKLYAYSPDKFFRFLKSSLLPADCNPEPDFTLHDETTYCQPAATLLQPSYRISVETKLNNLFVLPVLHKHFEVFRDEQYQILLTLGSSPLSKDIALELQKTLYSYNQENSKRILHKDMTFAALLEAVGNVLTEADRSFYEVLKDYQNYLISEHLVEIDYPQ